jgi:hypothetical protein
MLVITLIFILPCSNADLVSSRPSIARGQCWKRQAAAKISSKNDVIAFHERSSESLL